VELLGDAFLERAAAVIDGDAELILPVHSGDERRAARSVEDNSWLSPNMSTKKILDPSYSWLKVVSRRGLRAKSEGLKEIESVKLKQAVSGHAAGIANNGNWTTSVSLLTKYGNEILLDMRFQPNVVAARPATGNFF
jgi:hypothetical protein